MTVRELYKFLQETFPESQGGLNLLAWPLFQPLLGIQYIDKDGLRIGKAIENPSGFMFPEPLTGPFYYLPVVGIFPHKRPGRVRFAHWKDMSFVVQNKDDLFLSSSVSLHINMQVFKNLASILGIKWYRVVPEDQFICLPAFDV